MEKITYFEIVAGKLENMELNESFSKKEFITAQRGEYNYFMDRSFSVYFTNAKKRFPEKKFRSLKGKVTRLE